MKNVMIAGIAALAFVTAACGEPVEGGDEPLTKEEARRMGKADHVDWCEAYGWYDDGICDDFCTDPDPDCEEEIDCRAAFVVPNCEAGELLVDEQTCAVAGDDCRVDELCGVTSRCLFVGEFCPQVVGTPAACPSGTSEVETCESGDCVIARGSGDQCTDVAFCEPNGGDVNCTAVAVCGAGEMEVDAMTCLALGDECVTNEMCGDTAHCVFVGEFCPQVVGTPPECPDGTVEVDTCSDESCELVRGTGDQCATVKLCEPMYVCLGLPACEATQHNVSSEECLALGDSCESKSVCGNTLHCVDNPQFCPQVVGTPPACPAGKNEVSGCGTGALDSGRCEVVFGSGDQCANFIYCE